MNNYEDIQLLIPTGSLNTNTYIGFEGLFDVVIHSIDTVNVAFNSAPSLIVWHSQQLRKTNYFQSFMFSSHSDNSKYDIIYRNVRFDKYIDFGFTDEATRAAIALNVQYFIINLRLFKI